MEEANDFRKQACRTLQSFNDILWKRKPLDNLWREEIYLEEDRERVLWRHARFETRYLSLVIGRHCWNQFPELGKSLCSSP